MSTEVELFNVYPLHLAPRPGPKKDKKSAVGNYINLYLYCTTSRNGRCRYICSGRAPAK